jgi:hypothetical protein
MKQKILAALFLFMLHQELHSLSFRDILDYSLSVRPEAGFFLWSGKRTRVPQ